MANSSPNRVLGIDPFSRGVGFVVLEGPERLIDWGLRTTGHADNDKAARIVENLIGRFQPDVLSLEHWASTGFRRCKRVQMLLERIATTESRNRKIQMITREQIRAIGPAPLASTKRGRACLLTERFPKLGSLLPPFRKPWMPEDDRMAIFDALSFALSCYPQTQGPNTRSDEPV